MKNRISKNGAAASDNAAVLFLTPSEERTRICVRQRQRTAGCHWLTGYAESSGLLCPGENPCQNTPPPARLAANARKRCKKSKKQFLARLIYGTILIRIKKTISCRTILTAERTPA